MASRKKYTLQIIHMFINCLYVALFDKVLRLLGLLSRFIHMVAISMYYSNSQKDA